MLASVDSADRNADLPVSQRRGNLPPVNRAVLGAPLSPIQAPLRPFLRHHDVGVKYLFCGRDADQLLQIRTEFILELSMLHGISDIGLEIP